MIVKVTENVLETKGGKKRAIFSKRILLANGKIARRPQS
jgi:hypothetical protein